MMNTTIYISQIFEDSTHFILLDNTSDLVDQDIGTLKDISLWFWRTVSPLLFIIGIVGNSGIMIILFRMEFWKKNKVTYSFLFILAVEDTIVLCVGLPRYWILATFYTDIRNLSNFGCVTHLFLIYFSMQISSWTLVCITTDRCLKNRYPFEYRSHGYCSGLKIILTISFFVCIGINLHFFWTNALIKTDKGYVCTNTSKQNNVFEEKYFVFIDLVTLSILPFILMFTMSLLIRTNMRTSLRFRKISISNPVTRRNLNNRSHRMTRMLFFISVYFILATLPVSIFFTIHSFIIDSASARRTAELELAKTILYLFQFSNYSINFYIFIEVNEKFRSFLPSICITNWTRRSRSSPDHLTSPAETFRGLERRNSSMENNNHTQNVNGIYNTLTNSSPNGHVDNNHLSEISASCRTIPDLEHVLVMMTDDFGITDIPARTETEITHF